MKSIIKVLVTFLIISNSLNANAQFWKKLKKKVSETLENTVERKIDEKAEKTTNDTMDSIFSKKKKKSKTKKKAKKNSKDMNAMMESLMNSKNVKIEDHYNFMFTATMQLTNYSSNSSKTEKMQQSYGSNALYSVLESHPTPIIYDTKNNVTITIDEQEKTAMIMDMSFMQKFMKMGSDDKAIKNNPPKTTKTGKVKMIHGYNCFEYKIESNTTVVNAWFAPNVDFSYQDYLKGFSKMLSGNPTSPYGLLNDGYGYVMAMTAREDGKLLSKMEVTEISKKLINVDMSKYKLSKAF